MLRGYSWYTMMSMNSLLDTVRDAVRACMRVVARFLNMISRGKLSPDVITLVGLVAHIPIAYLIADGQLTLAAVLLVVFGLFDTLDGQLARVQKRTSNVGMFLDSVTDRMKEVFLYVGIAFFLVSNGSAYYAVWAVLALGGSVVTTYINAWGDVVMATTNAAHKMNKTFRGGFLPFEIRMFLMVVALLANKLSVFVVVMGILTWVTIVQRTFRVMRKLKDAES